MSNYTETFFDYTDEHGNLLYQIVRRDYAEGGKGFFQRRPDGHYDWINDIAGITPVPYKLVQLLAVVAKGGVIFLVEGEKCADVLNAALAGVCARATCNNGGAGKWGVEQSKWLKDAKVALLPDNDEAGNMHVETAARALQGLAASIRRIDLPGLAEKGDVADWLASGRTLPELQALYRSAPEYTPPSLPEPKKIERPKTENRRDDDDKERARLVAWALAALNGEIDKLSRLSDGRFHQLKASANRLGTIAVHGWLSESECMTGLMYALETNGYTQKRGMTSERAERIASKYFKSGLPHPCDKPAKPETSAAPAKVEASTPERPNWTMLPTIARGILLKWAKQGVGALVDLILEGQARGIIKNTFSVACLKYASDRLGRGLSERTLRRSIKDATNPHGVEFLTLCITYITDHSDPESGNDQLINATQTVKNPCGGRNPESFSLVPLDKIIANLRSLSMAGLLRAAFPADGELIAPFVGEFVRDLDLPDAESTARELMKRYRDLLVSQPGYGQIVRGVRRDYRRILMMLEHPRFAPITAGWSFAGTSDYAAAAARALVEAGERQQTQYTRADLCLYLGRSKAQLPGVYKLAGIKVLKNQHVDVPIKGLEQVKALLGKWDKHLKGFPKSLVSSINNVTRELSGYKVMDWAQEQLTAGATLSVRYAQANRQIIATKGVFAAIQFVKSVVGWIVKQFQPKEPVQQPLIEEPVQATPAMPEPAQPARAKLIKPKKSKEVRLPWNEVNRIKLLNKVEQAGLITEYVSSDGVIMGSAKFGNTLEALLGRSVFVESLVSLGARIIEVVDTLDVWPTPQYAAGGT